MVDAPTRLKLRAEEPVDLQVIAATLQGAVLLTENLSYRPRERRLVAMLNRYRWEAEDDGAPRGAGGERVRTALRFDFVDKVRTTGFRPGVAGAVLELHTITFEARDDETVEITLVFAGGARLKFEAECVDCTMDDIGEPWSTSHRPDYGLDAES